MKVSLTTLRAGPKQSKYNWNVSHSSSKALCLASCTSSPVQRIRIFNGNYSVCTLVSTNINCLLRIVYKSTGLFHSLANCLDYEQSLHKNSIMNIMECRRTSIVFLISVKFHLLRLNLISRMTWRVKDIYCERVG